MSKLYAIDGSTLKNIIDLLEDTIFLKDEEHGLRVAELVTHLQFNFLCKGPINLKEDNT